MLKVITEEECEKLLGYFKLHIKLKCKPHLNVRNLCLTKLLIETGLRVGELVQLVQLDLLVDNEPVHWLIVRPEIAKGNRRREIPLSTAARETIIFLKDKLWSPCCCTPTDYAFWGGDPKTPLSTRQVERIIEAASMAILGYRIHPHTLRHTFATRILRTSNVRIVQKLLGHKNITTTQLYTHPNNQDLREAIDGKPKKDT